MNHNGWTLYGDGGYTTRELAEWAMRHVEGLGGVAVGIVEGAAYGTWGCLYWSKEELYQSHNLNDKGGFFVAPLRANGGNGGQNGG